MSWVKLDDSWWTNPKIHRVEPLDRLLWIVSISWASREGTDGLIPAHMLGFLATSAGCSKPDDAAQRLTDARLWDLVPDGWQVHDYLHYQPTSTRREEQAEAHRKRQAEYEQRRRSPKVPEPLTRQARISDASSDALLTLLPSRPVPYENSSSTDELEEPTHSPVDDDDRIDQALQRWADLKAAQGAKNNSPGYKRTLLANATADGHRDAIATIARANPDRDPTWLADEHLGRQHPPDPNCRHCGQPRHTNGPCPTLLGDEDR